MELKLDLETDYCYTVKELAFIWNLSKETVRRMFIREPGVMIFQVRQTPGRREYRPLRIPGHVALRVMKRNTVVPRTP